jgi:hypothetical protein
MEKGKGEPAMASGLMMLANRVLCALIGLFAVTPVEAQVYVINSEEAGFDRRGLYTRALIQEALVRTEPRYGPAELKVDGERHSRLRLIQAVERGDQLSVAVLPSNPNLEERLLPVKIDLADGLLGLRVSLVREQDISLFSGVTAASDLKRFIAGAGADWEIALRFKQLGVTVLEAGDYEALFPMLIHGRFDHLSRSVMEVLDEYKKYKASLPELTVEPALLLETGMPLYAFLSPKAGALRQRLQEGLQALSDDGTIRRTVREQFEKDLIDLKVAQRRRIRLDE